MTATSDNYCSPAAPPDTTQPPTRPRFRGAATAELRAALPGWGILYDPWLSRWIAVRGKHAPPITAATPAELLDQINGTAEPAAPSWAADELPPG